MFVHTSSIYAVQVVPIHVITELQRELATLTALRKYLDEGGIEPPII